MFSQRKSVRLCKRWFPGLFLPTKMGREPSKQVARGNDGWKDLLISQGHDLDTIQLTFPNLRYREAMLLARNTGKGLVDVSAEAGSIFQQAWVGRGLVIGDIDNDGRLDARAMASNHGT